MFRVFTGEKKNFSVIFAAELCTYLAELISHLDCYLEMHVCLLTWRTRAHGLIKSTIGRDPEEKTRLVYFSFRFPRHKNTHKHRLLLPKDTGLMNLEATELAVFLSGFSVLDFYSGHKWNNVFSISFARINLFGVVVINCCCCCCWRWQSQCDLAQTSTWNNRQTHMKFSNTTANFALFTC